MASIVRYSRPTISPFGEAMDRLVRDALTLPRLLDDTFTRGTGLGLTSNLYETADAYVMQVLLPGAKLDELKVTAHRNVLSLEGATTLAAPEGARGIWVGLSGGEFREQVTLPGEVDADAATADYTGGILTLTLPKAERSQAKTIKINGAASGQPVIESQQ